MLVGLHVPSTHPPPPIPSLFRNEENSSQSRRHCSGFSRLFSLSLLLVLPQAVLFVLFTLFFYSISLHFLSYCFDDSRFLYMFFGGFLSLLVAFIKRNRILPLSQILILRSVVSWYGYW